MLACFQTFDNEISIDDILSYGSGAVPGKILLVTNACWILDCQKIPRSSNIVYVENFKFLEPPIRQYSKIQHHSKDPRSWNFSSHTLLSLFNRGKMSMLKKGELFLHQCLSYSYSRNLNHSQLIRGRKGGKEGELYQCLSYSYFRNLNHLQLNN